MGYRARGTSPSDDGRDPIPDDIASENDNKVVEPDAYEASAISGSVVPSVDDSTDPKDRPSGPFVIKRYNISAIVKL